MKKMAWQQLPGSPMLSLPCFENRGKFSEGALQRPQMCLKDAMEKGVPCPYPFSEGNLRHLLSGDVNKVEVFENRHFYGGALGLLDENGCPAVPGPGEY